MPPPLVLLQDISLSFGTTPVLAGAGLAVAAGDRLCLVGRNGSGKSTLLRIAAGLVQPDAGRRFAQPGATIRYLPQEPDLSGFATTLAYVEAGLDTEAEDDRHRARYLLHLLQQLGLTGDEGPATLSGGEARRAALARVLAPSPDVLLLDEPTNHLDLPGIEWLETRAGRNAIGHRADQPRPSPAGTHLARHRLARPRHHPDIGSRFRRLRGVARHRAGAGGKRAAQTRAQDRHGGGLAALWRHRAAQAQPEAARRAARAAQAAEGAARRAKARFELEAAQADLSGRLVTVAETCAEIVWRPA